MSEPFYARKPSVHAGDEPADERAHAAVGEPAATGGGIRTTAWSLRTLAAVAITTVALSGAAGAGLAAAGGGTSGGRGGFGGPPGMGRPGQLGGQTGSHTGGRLSGFRGPSGHRPVRAIVPGQLPAATAPGTERDL